MLLFTLYLILQLNSLITFFAVCTVIFIISAIAFVTCISSYDSKEVNDARWKNAKRWAIMAFVFAFVATILPTSKSATIMAGGWVLKEVVETDAAKRMASNSIKIIENWLAEKAKP